MDGFIRLNRKFFKGSYWNQKRTFSLSEAWLDLIFLARFDAEPTYEILPSGREITIKRGELRASLRFLSERWGWGVEKTKRFIDRHIEKHDIERRTEQGESILTLCNYGKYNPMPNSDTNTYKNTDQYSDRTVTSTNNKKVKKEKKEKEREKKREIPPPDSISILMETIDECSSLLKSRGDPFFFLVRNAVMGKREIHSTKELHDYIDQFATELKAKGEELKNPRDFQNHFINWIKKPSNGSATDKKTGGVYKA